MVRRDDENGMKIIMIAEVTGHCSQGRQKKWRGDIIQQNLPEVLLIKEEDNGDRSKFRIKIHVTDPFTWEGLNQAW